MMQRRRFVTGACGLVGAAGFFPAALLARAGEVIDFGTVEFGTGLSRSRFAALLRQAFYVHTETDGVVTLQLVGLEDSRPAASRLARKLRTASLEQFSLTFQGPALPVLPAGLYPIEHWLAGKTLLNLEPVEPCCYRADFALLS
jgi:Domain of unknown function (DUF6916)